MKKLTKIFAALSVIAGLGSVFVSMGASGALAANDVKPLHSAKGKNYYQKSKAKSSAIGRWEKSAAIKHGFDYGGWNKAKSKSVNCNRKFHRGNGKKLWTCTAKAKPVADVVSCKKGFIAAKAIHHTQKDAVKFAHKFWERSAAVKHGIKYSFYKNAKNRSMKCQPEGGKVQCVFKAIPCR